jgi:hypothetical protein
MAIAGAGGLGSLQAGTLSEFDPLYNYAKTAPILSLKGNTEYENLDFQPLPGTNYRLVVGGNVIGTASSPTEVAALVDAANKISAQGGAAVDVRLQQEVQAATRSGEAITAFNDIYANKENNMGALETLIPLALSVMGAGALTVPGAFAKGATAILPGVLGAGLGSAAGSLAGNLLVGRNLEQSLINAGISGLTAGAFKGIMPDVGGATDVLGQKLGATASNIAPGAANVGAGIGSNVASSALDDAIITVLGPRIAGAGLNTALGSIVGNLASAGVGDIGRDVINQANANQRSVDYINSLKPEDFGGRAAYNAFMNGYPEGYFLTNAGQLSNAAGDIIKEGLIPGSQAALDFAVSLNAGTAGAAAGNVAGSAASTLANAGAGALSPAAIAAATAAAAAQSGGNNTTTPVVPVTSSTSTQQGGDTTTPVVPVTSSTSTQQGGDTTTPVVPVTSSTSTQQGGDTTTPVVPVTVNTNTNTGGDTTTPVVPIETPSTNTPTSRTETVVLPVQTSSNTSTTEQRQPLNLLPQSVIDAQIISDIIGDSRAGPTTKEKVLSTLSLISGLSPLVGLLASAVGGGGGGGGTIDAGPGLPVGGIGGGRIRNPATFDPFTYGQREGEFDFFRNAPATTGTVTGIGGTGTTTGTTGTTPTGTTGTTTTGTTTAGTPGPAATAAEVQAAYPGYTNIRQDAQGRWFGEPIPGYTASGPAPTGLRVTAGSTFNPTVDDYRFFNPGFESIEPNAAGRYSGVRTVDVAGRPGMTLEQVRAANPTYQNITQNAAGQYVGTRTIPASTRAATLADYQAANPGFTRIEQGPDGQYYGFRNVTTTTAGPPVTLDQIRAANPGYEDYGINDAGQFYGTRTVTDGPPMAEGGEVDDDMVRHLIEYRKGGGHMGPGQVKGIGSGQEDKIPAWLSDGEYVWSAQDVADLGDGSTDEGVRRLDRMRKMVRQRAGRKDVKKIAKPQRGIEDMLKAVGGAV